MPDSHTVFEITSRTIQRRYLMRPSNEVNEIILGVIGRAQERYPGVALYLMVFMSNHFELLGSAPDFGVLSAFIGYLKSNIARELGELHHWKEKFWGRRFRAIPVLDESALLGRVRYILEHGCKENLVERPGDWPGVNCVAALTEGKPLVGWWYDRTSAYWARREGRELASSDFAQRYEVKLTPLPCWAHLTESERQRRYRVLVDEIEQDTRDRLKTERIRPLGVARVLAQDPHSSPESQNRSPAPLCHAVRRRIRSWYHRSYRRFVEAYRRASEQFRAGDLSVEFPPFCFRPPLPYAVVPTSAPG